MKALGVEGKKRSYGWTILQVGGALAAILLLWWNFRHLDLTETAASLTHAGPSVFWILIPIGLALLADTIGWQGLFAALDRAVPLGPLYGVRLASEAVLVAVSGGVVFAEGVGPVLLQRWRVPVVDSIATVALRKLLLAVSQTFYVGLGAVLGFEFLRRTSAEVLGGPGLEWLMIAATVILGLASAAIMVGLVHGAPGTRLFRALSLIPSVRLAAWLLRHQERFTTLDGHFSVTVGLKWTQLVGPTSLLFIAWMCETFETWLILRILGLEIGFIEVWAFEPALSLLRHLVFFVPAGLGFQDVGYVAFLRAAGVEDALGRGSAFVVLKRAKELFWAAVGLGLLALFSRRGKEVRA